MVIQRGDIWWASLPDPVGAMPGYRRPVLIVQADSFNQSAIRTVLAVVLTSNLRLAEAPGNILCPVKQTGLSKDSVANISQVVTVDKVMLTEKAGELSLPLLRQIEASLRLILSL